MVRIRSGRDDRNGRSIDLSCTLIDKRHSVEEIHVVGVAMRDKALWYGLLSNICTLLPSKQPGGNWNVLRRQKCLRALSRMSQCASR